MSITCYWFVGGQPSRAVASFLLAGGVEHESYEVKMME